MKEAESLETGIGLYAETEVDNYQPLNRRDPTCNGPVGGSAYLMPKNEVTPSLALKMPWYWAYPRSMIESEDRIGLPSASVDEAPTMWASAITLKETMSVVQLQFDSRILYTGDAVKFRLIAGIRSASSHRIGEQLSLAVEKKAEWHR